MRLKFSELKQIPKSQPLPEAANSIVRNSFSALKIAKKVPFLEYHFRYGVFARHEAILEFKTPEDALKAVEERKLFGKLIIPNNFKENEKVYFLENILNKNVDFNNEFHKPKEGTR